MTLLRQHIKQHFSIRDRLRTHSTAGSGVIQAWDVDRDRGGESIRLALAVGVTPVPPKITDAEGLPHP
jgi:hypothetical protein